MNNSRSELDSQRALSEQPVGIHDNFFSLDAEDRQTIRTAFCSGKSQRARKGVEDAVKCGTAELYTGLSIQYFFATTAL